MDNEEYYSQTRELIANLNGTEISNDTKVILKLFDRMATQEYVILEKIELLEKRIQELFQYIK